MRERRIRGGQGAVRETGKCGRLPDLRIIWRWAWDKSGGGLANSFSDNRNGRLRKILNIKNSFVLRLFRAVKPMWLFLVVFWMLVMVSEVEGL